MENADLVLGSRYSGGVRVVNWPLKRLMLSRCAGIYVWLVTGMPFTDPTGGYKCFRRRALQAINLDAVHSNGYSFQIEMTHRLWRQGFKGRRSADHFHRPRRRAIPKCPAASSPKRSGWSGGCGCKTACAAGRALIGKKIVLLYFYPKDNTPGCTKEACGFRDRLGGLQKDNVEVIGVSFDSAESHKKFIADYNLNFRLLADPDGKIVDLYDVRVVGRKMARRVSFLIGLDGKIVHVTDSGNPDVHFNEMKDAIAGLKKKK
jgi:peroxiredoxin